MSKKKFFAILGLAVLVIVFLVCGILGIYEIVVNNEMKIVFPLVSAGSMMLFLLLLYFTKDIVLK